MLNIMHLVRLTVYRYTNICFVFQNEYYNKYESTISKLYMLYISAKPTSGIYDVQCSAELVALSEKSTTD